MRLSMTQLGALRMVIAYPYPKTTVDRFKSNTLLSLERFGFVDLVGQHKGLDYIAITPAGEKASEADRRQTYVVDGPAPSVATTARRLGMSKREADEIGELVRTSMEPKTMTRVYAMAEEWFGRNRFTVWISNAGRTRHIAVRVKRGVMVEGVGPTWLEAFEDAKRLRKRATVAR